MLRWFTVNITPNLSKYVVLFYHIVDLDLWRICCLSFISLQDIWHLPHITPGHDDVVHSGEPLLGLQQGLQTLRETFLEGEKMDADSAIITTLFTSSLSADSLPVVCKWISLWLESCRWQGFVNVLLEEAEVVLEGREVGGGEGGEEVVSDVWMSGQQTGHQAGQLAVWECSQSTQVGAAILVEWAELHSFGDWRPPQLVRRGWVEAGGDGADDPPGWRTVLQPQPLPGRGPGGGQQQPGGADGLAGLAHTRGADHVRAVDERNTPPTPGLDHLLVLREDGARRARHVGVSREHHSGRYVCRRLTVEIRHPPGLDLLQGPGCLSGGENGGGGEKYSDDIDTVQVPRPNVIQ